ncbi:hypothetical protein [Streptomyces sp. NBC_01373]|uniref:hypothetical protein n=1 Tax=unclassified Streptomyces TaxID=2593676 RepID=UPI00225B8433|nr:hypothetical protein [Streptomyces sp. NBC_01373]MCX4706663.1 hypothetical protein [Streptomyces sp. NBC_01373]
MDQVDDDVDVRAALPCFRLDEVDLMVGPVDENDPGPAVLGLAERVGHHLGGGVVH